EPAAAAPAENAVPERAYFDIRAFADDWPDPPLGRGPIWERWPWCDPEMVVRGKVERPEESDFFPLCAPEWYHFLEMHSPASSPDDPPGPGSSGGTGAAWEWWEWCVPATPERREGREGFFSSLDSLFDRWIRIDLLWFPAVESRYRAIAREHESTFPSIPEKALAGLIAEFGDRILFASRKVKNGRRASADFGGIRRGKDESFPTGIAYEATAAILPDTDAVWVNLRFESAAEGESASRLLSIKDGVVVPEGFGRIVAAVYPEEGDSSGGGFLVVRARPLPVARPAVLMGPRSALHDATDLFLASRGTPCEEIIDLLFSMGFEEGVPGEATFTFRDYFNVYPEDDPAGEFSAAIARLRALARAAVWIDFWIADVPARTVAALPVSGILGAADWTEARVLSYAGRTVRGVSFAHEWLGSVSRRLAGHRRETWRREDNAPWYSEGSMTVLEKRWFRRANDAGIVARFGAGLASAHDEVRIEWDVEHRGEGQRATKVFASRGRMAIPPDVRVILEARADAAVPGQARALIARARPLAQPAREGER
ncbi:MAG: hypothetical protein JXP34_04230, partial [Planctomycetes bacterium]|nr:hypothetical protein [Planctomycetota bacterium]